MDTTELLQISRDKSVEGREKLAKSVTSLFMENDGEMSDRERSLMLDILHRLVHDFEKSVRTIIAKNLVDWSDIPQEEKKKKKAKSDQAKHIEAAYAKLKTTIGGLNGVDNTGYDDA